MSELPSGWRLVSLGEIGIIQSGIGFPNQEQGLTSGDYPVYKVGDVSRGVLQRNGNLQVAANYVTKRTAESLKGFVFPYGSTLFAKIGEALKLNRRGYVVRAGLADNNVMGYKAEPGVDDRFVYYFLKAQDFSSLSRSTTVPSIRKGDVEEVVVLLPPSAEQTRIAQKLDELLAQVDTLKARIDAIPKLLKRFRQSVLAVAVSGRLTEEWRMGRTSSERHSNSSLRVMQLNDESLVIPSLWREESLGGVINPQRKLCYGVVQPGVEVCQGVDLIRVCDIQDGKISWSELRKIDYAIDMEYRRSQVEDGDIVLSIVGSIGRAAIVRSDKQVNIARAIARISVDKSVMLPGWAYLWVSAPLVQWWLVSSSKEVARKTLNLKELIELPIPVPCLEEQTEIVRRVEQLFAFADQLEAKVQSAKARIDLLSQSILAKAFRGELVPQDPSDEPASVLLERIRAQRAAQPKARRGRKAGAAN